MICVDLNEKSFEYDVRGLLTSFFPGEQISLTDEPGDGIIAAQGEPGADRPGTGDGGADDEFALDGDLTGKRLTVECSIEEGAVSLEWRSGSCFYSDRGEARPGDRVALKGVLKRCLYELLVRDTGRELPWGTLTGIRPTHLVLQRLEEGQSPEECRRIMREYYLAGEEKTELALEIAQLEYSLLKDLAAGPAAGENARPDLNVLCSQGYSLYIGIPFCPSRCLYCSFASQPIDRWQGHLERYIDALFAELDLVKELFAGRKLHTVYIGGGTPASLSETELGRLLDGVCARFDVPALKEFCVEAGRPDTVTPEKFRVLRGHGVSRVSINPQTMNQATLDLIGRRHTVEQVKEAFGMARETGFSNINMDIILGLPGETEADVENTLARITSLEPDALTVHTLARKRASRLNTERGSWDALPAGDTGAQMELAQAAARGMGMRPYYLYRQKNMTGNLENTGFSKPGLEGLYNILMMEDAEDIAAAGAGTVSKRIFSDGTIVRSDNVKDPALYLERLPEMLERKRGLFS